MLRVFLNVPIGFRSDLGRGIWKSGVKLTVGIHGDRPQNSVMGIDGGVFLLRRLLETLD